MTCSIIWRWSNSTDGGTLVTVPLSATVPSIRNVPESTVLDKPAAHSVAPDRSWVLDAISILRDEATSAPETPLVRFPLPESWGVDLFLKDETQHTTGSLKHRLARSLFFHGLVNGHIQRGTTIVEASSGSTAISEAWFARLLGLKFVTVVPSATSPAKIRLIERFGGRCVLVDAAADITPTARALCATLGGYFMDQFGNASLATDWRRGNIASALFAQMAQTRCAAPTWIVVGVGTGGTSTTMGRFCRYSGASTRVAIADPEGSAYFNACSKRAPAVGTGSRIEGIGRPAPELAFTASVVDAAVRVPDALSVAAMLFLREHTGVWAGASTGTNLAAALGLALRMRDAGERGSIVTLVCDGGDRYTETYYAPAWLQSTGIDPAADLAVLRQMLTTDAAATATSTATSTATVTAATRAFTYRLTIAPDYGHLAVA